MSLSTAPAPVLPYGVTLDYPDSVPPAGLAPEFLRSVSEALRADGVALLRRFPAEPAALVAFARRFGLPQRLLSVRGKVPADDPWNWIADIRFRGDLPEADRYDLAEGAQPLALHTARATAAVQPQLFVMYMADPGDRGTGTERGQSHLARLDDALDRLAVEQGQDRADEIVRILAGTAFQPIDSCRAQPLVGSVLARKDNGSWKLRYWEGITGQAEISAPPELAEAIAALDAAFNHPSVRHEIVLDAGDLVLLDNERVAHGRRAFPACSTGPGGERIVSARQILNVKVFSELEPVG